MCCRVFSAVIMAAAMAAAAGRAGHIAYEPEEQRLVVSGFDEEDPATLSDVREADRAAGWNIVSHEPETDTWTVKCALCIGTEADWGTFFQIGRPEHPRETLVLHGDLQVNPPRPNPQRKSDGRFYISNRLTLGDPDNPEIRPSVRMACSRRNEFTIRVMAGDEGWPGRRAPIIPIGELFMFNATVTADTQDAEHTYAASITLSHTGVNLHMADSTFSWWSGDLFRPVFTPYKPWCEPRVMRGMSFEHGGVVRWFSFEDCLFRDLDIALTHSGATRCVFENNRHNLFLHPNHTGAALLDCVLGPSQRPMHIPRTRAGGKYLRYRSVNRHARDIHVVCNPGVVERRSLQVEVMNAQGEPVFGAMVWLSCPDEPSGAGVVRRLAVTDREGLTPGPLDERPLVIASREWVPTDDPDAPVEQTYVYRLRVEAPGHDLMEMSLDGAADIPCPMAVTLEGLNDVP